MRFSETGLCIKGLIVNPNSGQPREESTLCAVAEERPPAAHLFAAREVDVDEQQAVGLVAFGQKLALRAANETMAPELYIGTLPI